MAWYLMTLRRYIHCRMQTTQTPILYCQSRVRATKSSLRLIQSHAPVSLYNSAQLCNLKSPNSKIHNSLQMSPSSIRESSVSTVLGMGAHEAVDSVTLDSVIAASVEEKSSSKSEAGA